jgi:predicted RecA/RadA family phage recombinase
MQHRVNTHEADPPSCFCETTVNEDSTTSITSGETHHQESKHTKLPRLIHSKTIDKPEFIDETNQPTDPASKFSKVLPDVQDSSDTNMETILGNHLRRTASTADEIIIVGKIYNFAAAETVKAGEKSDSSQDEVYRLQGKLDTALAEQERLRSESDKTELLASRAREDIRKANDELQNVRKSQLDRAQLQLSKSEEHEKKLEEELEMLRDPGT